MTCLRMPHRAECGKGGRGARHSLRADAALRGRPFTSDHCLSPSMP